MENPVSVFVNFLVLPLFAFVNAQVRFVGADLAAVAASPVAHGAWLGAVLGKPLGIVLVTWLLVKVGFAKLPKNMDWVQVGAVGIMGGLGFTMSILISGLAFADPADVMASKCAILLGSVSSALIGIAFVMLSTRRRRAGDSHPGRRVS